MNASDIINRSDALLKKYGHYSAPSQKKPVAQSKSSDPFQEQYAQVIEKIEEIEDIAREVAADPSNRARVAQKNAEIRKMKQQVITRDLDGEQGLERNKRKGKASKEEIEKREDMIEELRNRLDLIQDGISQPRRKPQKNIRVPDASYKPQTPGVREDAPLMNPQYFQHTEETRQFDNEWQEAKTRQDDQLDRIGQGVSNLKQQANDMGEHLERQEVFLDDMEKQMDKVTESIKTNNTKLKGALTQMRSTRNICIDITLVIVFLAIGAYIYTLVT